MNFTGMNSSRFATPGPSSALRAATDAEPSPASSRVRQDPWPSNQAERTRIGNARDSMERYAMVAARVLVAMIFMMNALNIIGQTLAAHEMAAHGVPVGLVPTIVSGATRFAHGASQPNLDSPSIGHAFTLGRCYGRTYTVATAILRLNLSEPSTLSSPVAHTFPQRWCLCWDHRTSSICIP
jgi:hypothetical protein